MKLNQHILTCFVRIFRFGLMVVASGQAAAALDNLWQPAQTNATWQTECGACHMAFPPGMLSVDDWLDLLTQLEHHFGADANLEPKAKAEIADYFKQFGARSTVFGSRNEVPRITTSDRFIARHRSAQRLWQKGQIKSLADCAACHKEAASK
jgi:mono/diheme cytochrome c family protein